MKTILIETVSNGWIVRPFEPSKNWVCSSAEAIAVFTDMATMQSHLPLLLDRVGEPSSETVTQPTQPS